MRVSVVVRSKDEADRLRLTLLSLAQQTTPAEVVVVDDGSSDHTPEVLAEASGRLQLSVIRNPAARGRSAASNQGAAGAEGDILLFLDGDTLAHPELVSRHLALHQAAREVVGRGETYHLRCTRFFANPETGAPRPGEEERVARLSPAERERMCITRRDVAEHFASIEARAQPGIYPGAGPRQLFELEMDSLRNEPASSILWAAASGANQSVPRRAFLEAGGFDEALTINEHRELALRLTRRGLRMRAADGARNYHMTHRSGWRDPVQDREWEQRFYETHPLPAVALLSVFWASLGEASPFPSHGRIRSLAELEVAAERCAGVVGIEAVREAYFSFSGQNARELVAS